VSSPAPPDIDPKWAALLVDAGHDARNLTGGMQAWAAAGLPVVRGDGAPGEVA